MPDCLKDGDEIWIIYGVRLPLLLRKSIDFLGCYQLVGRYLDGKMQAVAMDMGFEVRQVALV